MFQVLIEVPERGSVVTWDFDILKGDVTFTVFRCRQTRPSEPHHQHHVSGTTTGVGSVQYIDKNMVVGRDISIVEPPNICRDGDSVQVCIYQKQSSFEICKPTYIVTLGFYIF